jgi:hypothetical protein
MMWRVLPEEIHGMPLRVHTIMDFLEDYPDPNSAFVITEARYDSEIYANFFDYPKKCRLIFGQGRRSVESAFPVPIKYRQRSVGIIDRDFDYAIPEKQYPEWLIVTHTHDIETTLLSSPAFNSLIEVFGDKKKMKQFEEKQKKQIVRIVLDAAKPLGLFRLHNFLQSGNGKIGLNFKNLDFIKFIERETLRTNLDCLIECVISNSNQQAIPWCNRMEIKKAIIELNSRYRDDWVICQGHDIVSILSIGFHYIFGIQGRVSYPSKTVQAKLKDSSICRREFISGNQFYQKLLLWEQRHIPFRLLVE